MTGTCALQKHCCRKKQFNAKHLHRATSIELQQVVSHLDDLEGGHYTSLVEYLYSDVTFERSVFSSHQCGNNYVEVTEGSVVPLL